MISEGSAPQWRRIGSRCANGRLDNQHADLGVEERCRERWGGSNRRVNGSSRLPNRSSRRTKRSPRRSDRSVRMLELIVLAIRADRLSVHTAPLFILPSRLSERAGRVSSTFRMGATSRRLGSARGATNRAERRLGESPCPLGSDFVQVSSPHGLVVHA
jgi:hypothetical protein